MGGPGASWGLSGSFSGSIFSLFQFLFQMLPQQGRGAAKCNLNLVTGGQTAVSRNCRDNFSKTLGDKINGCLLGIPVAKYVGRPKLPPPNTQNRAGTKLARPIQFGQLSVVEGGRLRLHFRPWAVAEAFGIRIGTRKKIAPRLASATPGGSGAPWGDGGSALQSGRVHSAQA